MTAAEHYAARVDAVILQRERLRGTNPSGDPFAGLPPGHTLLVAEPRAPLAGNRASIAAYVEPDDVIVDIGGGAGRISLPLALRARELINVEESLAMGTAFEANASHSGITNARFVHGSWMDIDPPSGDLLLLNHVLYLTRDVVPFIERLNASARRRVLITLNNPPPPTWFREYYRLVFDEVEELVPGHAELVNVLWEMGLLPDVLVLPNPSSPAPVAPTQEAAIDMALGRITSAQWAFWPLEAEVGARARSIFESRFDELFVQGAEGFSPRWFTPGREVLITWTTP